jgi:hypothetical protein
VISPRRFIVATLAATLLVGGAVVCLNVWVDLYGLFRDTHGRTLGIYDSERRGKYLLSVNYVPRNFDAILLGSSVTSNWNTAAIRGLRTYNESTDGGNITEERLLAERALATPGLKVAICLIHPYLTDAHGVNADEMRESEIVNALGSISLGRSYWQKRAVERGRAPLVWDPLGTEFSEVIKEMRPLNPVLTRIMKSEGEVHVDQMAFDEYRTMVGELRAHGLRLVAVIPPTIDELLAPRRARMDRYNQRLLALFSSPGDLIIDLNAPDLGAFRHDRINYRDGVHLSVQGAAAIMQVLDRRITDWTAGREPTRAATTEIRVGRQVQTD